METGNRRAGKADISLPGTPYQPRALAQQMTGAGIEPADYSQLDERVCCGQAMVRRRTGDHGQIDQGALMRHHVVERHAPAHGPGHRNLADVE